MKKVLGRGLESLIPTIDETESNSGVIEIDINLIDPNRDQPRKQFNEDSLNELAESIKNHGIVQPLIVSKNGERHTIIAGERRWRAARIAGLKKVPVIIKDYTPRQLIEIALIENIQREDLNAIEEAEAYKMLMTEFELTQEELSKSVGKSRPAIANSLRLNFLPDQIKALLRNQEITAGHARALIGISDTHIQLRLAEQIIKNGLSVRDTEKMAALIKNPKNKKPKPEKPVELTQLEDSMKQFFGTKVKINGSVNRGKIEIEYYNRDDIERILELINIGD